MGKNYKVVFRQVKRFGSFIVIPKAPQTQWMRWMWLVRGKTQRVKFGRN